MKKLYSLYEAVSKVNSSLYTNLEFPTGVTAGASPGTDSINDVLLKDIDAASKAAGLKVSITTAVSGHKETTKSGNTSRHTNGTGVDIAIINGVSYKSDPTKFTQLGNDLVAQLKSMGYDSSGSESGHPKALLWQVADHYNHVHVSNNSGSASSSGTSNDTTGNITADTRSYTASEVGEPNDEFTTAAANMTRGFVEPIVNAMVNKKNESISNKEKRILENIQKIKRLL